MVAEQEEEEDKVGWRLEKEVEALRQAQEDQLTSLQRHHQEEASRIRSAHLEEVSKLKSELERVQSLLKRTEEGSQGWEEIIEAKDRELANLQAALGELTYESDAAERLRSEVRGRGRNFKS